MPPLRESRHAAILYGMDQILVRKDRPQRPPNACEESPAMSHYHETALTESRASWRLPFWEKVRDARRERQERIANMIVPLVWGSVADCERGLDKRRMVDLVTFKQLGWYYPFNRPSELYLAKREAKEYESAINRLLSTDFNP